MTRYLIYAAVLWVLCGVAAAQDGDTQASKDRALVQSAYDGELARVEGLVRKGAAVDATGPKDRTALMWAAANGHTKVAEFLHGEGADVNAKDSKGHTALMFAAKGSHEEMVEYLLENGADVNARTNRKGFTALIVAAAVGNAKVVQLLLDHGADRDVVELGGYTALDRAKQYGHPEIVALLEVPAATPTDS